MAISYGDIAPGYKNPLGDDAPSIKGSFDWGSFSKGTDWNQTPEIDKTGLFESLFDKAKKRDKYRSQVEEEGGGGRFGADRGFGGEWSRGGSGQILDNLGAIYPQQFSPMYIPGVQGESGMFSKIAGVAAPFASLIPGVGPVVSAGLSAASRTGW